MRQAGFLAAAASYALDHHIPRLADDHKKAKEIGQVLQNLAFIKKVESIETNIIIFEINEQQISAEDFLKKLLDHHVYIIGMGQGKLRIVTHLDYTDAMHEEFLRILKKL
jgi:threonine aldolase